MRIAVIALEFPTEDNFDHGAGVSMGREVRALMERGHEVEVFVWSARNEVLDFFGARLHRISTASSLMGRLLNRVTMRQLWPLWLCVDMSFRQWCAFSQRHKADPFHVVMGAMSGGVTYFATLFSRVPVVVRASQFQPYLTAYDGPRNLGVSLRDRFEILAMRRAEKVWTKSAYLADVLSRECGIRADVIEPPFMIEVAEFDDSLLLAHRLNEYPYILSWGPLGLTKGIDVMTEALEFLMPTFPDLRFVWVGTERLVEGVPAWGYIQRMLPSGYRDRVLWLGKVSKPRMYSLLAHARCVATAARTGNLPNTVLEAMALGRPIVGARGASLEQLVEEGVTGFLVPQEQPEVLAEALAKILQMPGDEYETMGAAARARMEAMNPMKAGKRLAAYLQSAVGS